MKFMRQMIMFDLTCEKCSEELDFETVVSEAPLFVRFTVKPCRHCIDDAENREYTKTVELMRNAERQGHE